MTQRWLPGAVYQQTDRDWTHIEDSSGLAGSPGSHAEGREKQVYHI